MPDGEFKLLKVRLFQNEILVSKIFQNCNEKIVRIFAQKSLKKAQIKQIKTLYYVK